MDLLSKRSCFCTRPCLRSGMLLLITALICHHILCVVSLQPSNLPVRLDLRRRQPERNPLKPVANSNLTFWQLTVQSSVSRAALLNYGGKAGGRGTKEQMSRDGGFVLPVSAGGGDYITTIELGTPALQEIVLVDTGSDLVWVQCLPCTQCFPQEGDIFSPSSSSSFHQEACSSKPCKFLPTHSCNENANCLYEYQYGDGSASRGNMANEILTLRTANNKAHPVKGFTFGCGHDNTAVFGEQGSGPAGILGLGRGHLSLPSQLFERIAGKFSYCLVNWNSPSSVISPLFLGLDHPPHGIQYTPILVNGPVPTYYYVDLQNIFVAKHRLPIPPSVFEYTSRGGGSIFDSGTTLTFLPPIAYKQLKKAIVDYVSLSPLYPPLQGFDLCYSHVKKFPSLAFHFRGGANMSVPSENYMVTVDEAGTRCLGMRYSGENFTIIGNLQ